MKIKILAFGIAKEIIGASNLEMEVENECNVLKLKNHLESKYPKLKALKGFSIAVNQNYIADNLVLNENDEIVLLPPVSGG